MLDASNILLTRPTFSNLLAEIAQIILFVKVLEHIDDSTIDTSIFFMSNTSEFLEYSSSLFKSQPATSANSLTRGVYSALSIQFTQYDLVTLLIN